MRAADVVLAHADLLERMADTRMQGFVDHNAEGNLIGPDGRALAGTGRTLRAHLSVARPFHVEPDLLDLALQRAEHRMVSTDKAIDYLPRVEHGFVVLGKPWWMSSTPGITEAVHAFTWGSIRSGVLVTSWTDISRDQDDVWLAMRAEVGAQYDAVDQERGWAEIDRIQGRWVIANVMLVKWDDVLGPSHESARLHLASVEDDRVIEIVSLRRLMCSLWALFDEVLPGGRREPAEPEDRRARKLAKRLKIPTQVEMVTLRRETTPVVNPGSGTPLRWRVPVTGHPRTYHRGTDREYTIWIHDHEKGPKDAPYSMRKTVSNLKR